MLKRFFILCSGVDKDIVLNCSDGEQNKYAGIGATVFFTAVMAFIAVAMGTTAVAVLVGVVSAHVNATTNDLYNGDSETRITVLKQIEQSFGLQAPQPIEPQSAAWILPAIEQCRTDSDPEVVALAGKLADYINDNTSLPPP